MAIKDHYLVLGISRRENFSGIRDAYRELAKQHDPERVGPDAVDRFRDLRQAYENLSDPLKRRTYDRDLEQNEIIRESLPQAITYPPRRRPEFRAPGPLSLLREFGNIRPSFETLYERFLRNFTRRQIPKGERIEALNVDLLLSREESADGGTVAVGIPVFFACPHCYGSGHEWLFPCATCTGRGIIETEETISIRIPPRPSEKSAIEVSIHSLGIDNFFLSVHTRVSRRE